MHFVKVKINLKKLFLQDNIVLRTPAIITYGNENLLPGLSPLLYWGITL